MKKIVFIIFMPLFVFSQQLTIKKLTDEVNSKNAEFNFMQYNDTVAFYTVARELNGKFISEIFELNLVNELWNNKQLSKYNPLLTCFLIFIFARDLIERRVENIAMKVTTWMTR